MSTMPLDRRPTPDELRDRVFPLVARHRPEEYPAGVTRCVNCHWDWPCPSVVAAASSFGLYGVSRAAPPPDHRPGPASDRRLSTGRPTPPPDHRPATGRPAPDYRPGTGRPAPAADHRPAVGRAAPPPDHRLTPGRAPDPRLHPARPAPDLRRPTADPRVHPGRPAPAPDQRVNPGRTPDQRYGPGRAPDQRNGTGRPAPVPEQRRAAETDRFFRGR